MEIKKFFAECSDCAYNICLLKEQRKNHSLSVVITTIALSIFTFPFFLAVSLIRGYFKNKDVKVIPDFKKEAIILGVPVEQRKPLEERLELFNKAHPLTQEEQIVSFVARFLHPYITGQIRPAGEVIDPKLAQLQGVINEPEERRPMIELLHQEFNVGEKDQAEIDEMAIDAYLQVAAQGMFVYINCNKLNLKLSEDEKAQLINAVRYAFRIDFPNYAISDEDLEQRTLAALTKVDKLRDDESIKILDARRERDAQQFLASTQPKKDPQSFLANLNKDKPETFFMNVE